MNNRELALQFIKLFCEGDIDGLSSLLAEDLRVTGPLLQVTSRAQYVGALRNDPPGLSSYKLLSLTDDADHVSVFYEYRKQDATTVAIAQLFGFRNGKIKDMLLVFDRSAFD